MTDTTDRRTDTNTSAIQARVEELMTGMTTIEELDLRWAVEHVPAILDVWFGYSDLVLDRDTVPVGKA